MKESSFPFAMVNEKKAKTKKIVQTLSVELNKRFSFRSSSIFLYYYHLYVFLVSVSTSNAKKTK